MQKILFFLLFCKVFAGNLRFNSNYPINVEDVEHKWRDVSDGKVEVVLDTSRVWTHVEPHFLSYCIDSYVFDAKVHWLKFNFSSPRLKTLVGGLSPSYLRVGGYPADYLFFDLSYHLLKATNVSNEVVVMTKEDIVNLVELTKVTGGRLLFELNLQVRFGRRWNPSNAIHLMNFLQERGYGDNIDWELGNEPSYWAGNVATAKEIAEDFRSLWLLLRQYPLMRDSVLVGPDVITVDPSGMPYLKALANYSSDALKAITFHHYYIRGDKSTYKDYMNFENFQKYDDVISMVRRSLEEVGKGGFELWNGETSDAWNSGTRNVSDRFVSGFLWLDKLGLSARRKVKVVMRQTLYGHYYPLLDEDMWPNPDYWLSWLHKKLVGTMVLRVAYGSGYLRVYAQCTRPGSTYKEGAVTVFGLNLANTSTTLVQTPPPFPHSPIHAYILEADPDNDDGVGDDDDGGADGDKTKKDDLFLSEKEIEKMMLAKHSKLNGRRLEMVDEYTLPSITPTIHPPSSNITLPALSFFFLVYPEAHLLHCEGVK